MTAARVDSAAVCRDYSILPFLPEPKPLVPVRKDQWKALCPFHADRTPSMLVGITRRGAWGFTCYGCGEKGDVIAFVMRTRRLRFLEAVRAITGGDVPMAVELPKRALKNREAAPRGMASKLPGNPVATYDYIDEQGVLLYQVLRYEPKTFRQRQPHPSGEGWNWSMAGARRVLYRLPELLEAPRDRTVYVVEGEKDVEALRSIGRVATTNVGGAGPGKWLPSYSESLKGRKVLVVPDNDAPGEKHALALKAALEGVAASVALRRLPGEFKDVSEWLAWRRQDQQPKGNP